MLDFDDLGCCFFGAFLLDLHFILYLDTGLSKPVPAIVEYSFQPDLFDPHSHFI
jgi:hypothetical protein